MDANHGSPNGIMIQWNQWNHDTWNHGIMMYAQTMIHGSFAV